MVVRVDGAVTVGGHIHSEFPHDLAVGQGGVFALLWLLVVQVEEVCLVDITWSELSCLKNQSIIHLAGVKK